MGAASGKSPETMGITETTKTHAGMPTAGISRSVLAGMADTISILLWRMVLTQKESTLS
jgi:hypothetical protein